MKLTRKKISKKQVLLFLGDLFILNIAPFITIYVYFISQVGFGFKFQYVRFENFYYISNLILFLAVFYIMDLYNSRKNFASRVEVLNIFLAICIAWGISILFFYISGHPPLGRGITLIYLMTLFILVVLFRYIYSKILILNRYAKKTIIVGAARGGEAVATIIKKNPQLNIKIVCFLEIDKQKEGKCLCDVPIVCKGDNLLEAISHYKPDQIIIAMRKNRYEKILKDLIYLSQEGIEIRDITSIYEEIAGKIPIKYVSDTWILYSHINKSKIYFYRLKRLVDIVLSVILLILSSPVMLITSFAIKMSYKGSVFCKGARVGKNGKNFNIVMFKSTPVGENKNNLAVPITEGDMMETRLGKIIRKLRIDQLPQLFNVLKGDMSIVGPKAEIPEYANRFLGQNKDDKDIIPHYGERLTVKPGLTGWAQVMFPYASSYEKRVEKMEYDLYYIKNMSFLLDVSIILKTIRVVLFGKGVK